MRIKKGGKSKKSSDVNYWTEYELYKWLCKKYRFYPNCDLAATKANSLCYYYYDKETDALKQDRWRFPRSKKRLRGWCNPPNDKIGLFLEEIYRQYDTFGIRTMMIVPSNVEGTIAWWNSVEDPQDRGEKIFFRAIYRRPKFKLRGRNSKHTSINSYKVVIFGRSKYGLVTRSHH